METAHLQWVRLTSHREKMKRHWTLIRFLCSVLFFFAFLLEFFRFFGSTSCGAFVIPPPPPLSLPTFHSLTNFFFLFYRVEYLTNITEIETEGVEDETNNLWVESYYVSTSNSTEGNSFVNYTEDGKTKIVSR